MAFGVARDGRKAYVYLVKEKAEKTTGALTVGKWYHVKKKGSETFLGTLEEGHAFYCAKESCTPGEGSEFYELELGFLGFAQGKNMSESKNTTDVTADKDEATQYVLDPNVSVSGSISGIDLMEQYNASNFNAITELRQRFNNVVEYNSEGTLTYHDIKATVRDVIIIGWDMREVANGDPASFDIIPCVLSSKSRDGAYGSAQTMNIDFSGCDSSDTGLRRSHQQIIYKGLTTA